MTADDSTPDQPSDSESPSEPETPPADDAQPADRADTEPTGARGRDVVVPMRVYKAVTVFTTLFAVATVVGGFILLDTATDSARAELSEIQPVLALVGIGLIVVGAAAYAFSTRFRADGMGKSKDDTDEESDNG